MLVKRPLAGIALLALLIGTKVVADDVAPLFQLVSLPLVESSNGPRTLFDFQRNTDQFDVPRSAASLFTGRVGTSFFAPYPLRENKIERRSQLSKNALQAIHIRNIIGQAEAGKNGYNAVQHGAKLLPPRVPTELTIADIYAWIDQTPGQHHAIGRYQFIPMTLKRLVDLLEISDNTLFTAAVQDELADALLVEAGLNALSDGEISLVDFMNNMAKIWAGLPTSSGLSYYDGVAGNKATMTWAYFDAEMSKIFTG